MNNQILNNKVFQSILLGISFFVSCAPFYLWHSPLILILSVIGCIIMIQHTKADKSFFIPFFIIIGYVAFANGANFSGFLSVLMLLPLVIVERSFLIKSYKIFFNIYIFFISLSIINYLFVYAGISLPHLILDPANKIKDYTYTAYPFLVIPNIFQFVPRFCGLFEEPGNVGTLAILLLGIERANLQSWKNWIIIVSGILSFSLFFYIAFLFILFIWLCNNRTHIKYKLASLFIFIFIVLQTNIVSSPIFQMAILDRLEYDETRGTIRGNSRSSQDLDNFYEKIRWKSDLFFWGASFTNTNIKSLNSYIDGGAGYKTGIICNGLVGCILYFLFFLTYSFYSMKRVKNVVIFMLFFLMTLWQRPFLLDPSFLVLFFVWININSIQSTNKFKINVI